MQHAAEGCRIKGSPGPDIYTHPMSTMGGEALGELSVYTSSLHPVSLSPSPTPGSGSVNVWGDTMEVPLMYFLSLFPCTHEEQCVCASVCKYVCMCTAVI